MNADESTLSLQPYPLWLCVRRPGKRLPDRYLVVAWEAGHGELIPWGDGQGGRLMTLVNVLQDAESQGHAISYTTNTTKEN